MKQTASVIDVERINRERASLHIKKGSECAAEISVILYYASPDAIDSITSALIQYAEHLVSKNVDKRKRQDYKAGKHPFRD